MGSTVDVYTEQQLLHDTLDVGRKPHGGLWPRPTLCSESAAVYPTFCSLYLIALRVEN